MGAPAPLVRNPDGVLDALRASLGAAMIDGCERVGELSITVAREAIADVLTTLRDAHEYQQLMEIAGVDYPDRTERFEVVYHLLSVTRNNRLRVRVSTDEATPVPTVTGVYPVAGWLEREVFDMYGVVFGGNPDLRRILTDYGFSGHPFRKDFPLTGYVEVRYSETEKRVVYEPVNLAQDLRSFDFLSPWEGAQYVLPGDEKAVQGEAKGAPTPATAEQNRVGGDLQPKAPPGDVKVTRKTSETGAGEPANTIAAEPEARAPRVAEGDDAHTESPNPAEDAAAAKLKRAPRKPKG